MLKNCKFTFSAWGLGLFLLVMLPNFIWFAVPAPNDVLRNESITPVADMIGSVAQVVFVAALCLFVRTDVKKVRFSPFVMMTIACVLVYFAGWLLYYLGMTGAPVILMLTVPPCLAFIFFALDRKNCLALIPAAVFTVCHVIFGVVNFII